MTALTGTPAGVALKNGQVTFATSSLSAGSHSPALTQVVNKETTTVSLSSSPNPSGIGQNVTFGATVRPIPTGGSITFKDGTTVLEISPLTNGAAGFSTSALSLGKHSITATYSGDGGNNGGVSPVFTQTVGPDTTTTVLTITPATAIYGQTVAFRARVSAPLGTPTGSVSFTAGATSIGSAPLSNGIAVLRNSTLAVGTYKVIATYGGSTSDGPSSDAAALKISQAVSSIRLTSSQNPSNTGAQVIFTARLTSSAGAPTGSVAFSDGATPLGTAPVNAGSASLPISTLAAGPHSIVAVYSGDDNFTGVTSSILRQVVNRGAPRIALSSSLTTSGYGQPVTFTATVTSAVGAPSGSVTFFNSKNNLGSSPLAGGAAQITVSTLSVGAHSITAVYSGDSVFAPVTSAPLTFIVNSANTTTSVLSSINPSRSDQNFVLTATVATPYGTPTGSVTFSDQSQALGVGRVVNGKATLTTYYVLPGTHYITARYSGDTNYQGSTSAPYTQQVSVTDR